MGRVLKIPKDWVRREFPCVVTFWNVRDPECFNEYTVIRLLSRFYELRVPKYEIAATVRVSMLMAIDRGESFQDMLRRAGRDVWRLHRDYGFNLRRPWLEDGYLVDFGDEFREVYSGLERDFLDEVFEYYDGHTCRETCRRFGVVYSNKIRYLFHRCAPKKVG